MKTINRFLFCTLIIMMFSCDDIFEEDITDDIIQLISPVNDAEIESNVVNFRWNKLEGADKYRIQIYSNQFMLLDSLINRESFTYALSGGIYQWRVRGENSAYESSYSFPSNFKMIESSDLRNQQVILLTPQNGSYRKVRNIICTWQRLNAADSYIVELINFTDGQNLIERFTNITNTSITFDNTLLTVDAEYQWRVKAVNSDSETLFYSANFNIDTVNPNQPQNVLPANNSTQSSNQTITFTWDSPADSGVIQSPISYTVEFANVNTFTPIIQTSNSTVPTIQQVFTAPGDYYWRIKATDRAGNVSVYSNSFKFTIN